MKRRREISPAPFFGLIEKTIYYVANFAAYIITCIGESIKYFSQLDRMGKEKT